MNFIRVGNQVINLDQVRTASYGEEGERASLRLFWQDGTSTFVHNQAARVLWDVLTAFSFQQITNVPPGEIPGRVDAAE